LNRYKNDHVQSSLPKEVNENASIDPRIWKLGPLSLNPLVWHQYSFALDTPSKDIRNPHTMKLKQGG
jgi:hypothetical protein